MTDFFQTVSITFLLITCFLLGCCVRDLTRAIKAHTELIGSVNRRLCKIEGNHYAD